MLQNQRLKAPGVRNSLERKLCSYTALICKGDETLEETGGDQEGPAVSTKDLQ